ncbi:MAG: DUF1028 domain-containing protein [Pseudomonadota bacterium]
MTFSIVARCPESGLFGMAVASSSPAVAARCAHVRAGVGAAASQNITDPMLGPAVLDRMEAGQGARDAVAEVMERHVHRDYRQVLAVDKNGGIGTHSGGQVLGIWGEATGEGCLVGGNLLANEDILPAMIAGFAGAGGHLGERLIAALLAGLDAGGEAGPVHSAGLKIADRLPWPLVDLRVDWADAPIDQLAAAWSVYAPQMLDYVQRAEDPTGSASFGVPGDP